MDEYHMALEIAEHLKAGHSVAVAFNIEKIGSSPAREGAAMLVTADGGQIGSVGGGSIELIIHRRCQEALAEQKDSFYDIPLNEADMICGGRIKGVIKVFKARPYLIIAGGGHIGHALYKHALLHDLDIAVVDSRPGIFDDGRFAEAAACVAGYDMLPPAARQKPYVVVTTFGSQSDFEAAAYFLSEAIDFSYLGMLGSIKKLKDIFARLTADAAIKQNIERCAHKIYAPIGLGIASDKPDEIALAILAEIVMLKNNGHSRPLKQEELYL
jgi:xanthine dehydrogenase accessory factor